MAALLTDAIDVAVSGAVHWSARTDSGGVLVPMPETILDAGGDFTAFDDNFYPVGLLTSDGVEEQRSTDTENVDAWQLSSPARVITTSDTFGLQFTMLETKPVNLSLYDRVPLSAMTYTAASKRLGYAIGETPEEVVGRFVVTFRDGSKAAPKVSRILVPSGKVTEVDNVPHSKSGATQRQVTVTAYFDSVAGFTAYKMIEGAGWPTLDPAAVGDNTIEWAGAGTVNISGVAPVVP